jgi:hypothetical protein
MKCFLALLLTANSGAFAKETAEVLPSDLSKVRPTMVVDCNNKILGDNADAEGACWHFVKKDEHPAVPSVGQLFAGGEPRCTGTVIVPPNCSNPAKVKPQVITNGHCSLHASGGFSMKFNGLEGVPADKRIEIGAKKIYSSENRMDIGVYELDTTIDQLSRFGMKATKLAASMGEGTFANLTMPLQDVPEDKRNLRINPMCETDKRATVVDQYRIYPNVFALKKCSAVGGASGSGLFNEAGELAGVMVAGVYSKPAKPPQHVCQLDTCFYEGEGAPSRYESNFGFDVTGLNNCYSDCTFSFKNPGCPLADPDSTFGTVVTSRDPVWTTTLDNTINFTNGKFSKLHVKMCTEAKTCSCQDSKGYVDGPKGSLRNQRYGYTLKPSDYVPPGTKIKAKPKEPATFQFLCLRGETPDGKLDDLKNAMAFPQWLYDKGSIFNFK